MLLGNGVEPAETELFRGRDSGAVVPRTGLDVPPNGRSPLSRSGAGKVRSKVRSRAGILSFPFDDVGPDDWRNGRPLAEASNVGGGERRKSKLVSGSTSPISMEAGLPNPPRLASRSML